MQQVLIDQHSPYFAGYGTLYQSVIRFLIQQYLFSYTLWIIVIIFQLGTLLMLFTRRFDPWICFSIFLYLIFDFCFMNINFFPFIIFIIVFIPSWPTIASFYKSEYRLM